MFRVISFLVDRFLRANKVLKESLIVKISFDSKVFESFTPS